MSDHRSQELRVKLSALIALGHSILKGQRSSRQVFAIEEVSGIWRIFCLNGIYLRRSIDSGSKYYNQIYYSFAQ